MSQHFQKFTELPSELQQMVWKEAEQEARSSGRRKPVGTEKKHLETQATTDLGNVYSVSSGRVALVLRTTAETSRADDTREVVRIFKIREQAERRTSLPSIGPLIQLAMSLVFHLLRPSRNPHFSVISTPISAP